MSCYQSIRSLAHEHYDLRPRRNINIEVVAHLDALHIFSLPSFLLSSFHLSTVSLSICTLQQSYLIEAALSESRPQLVANAQWWFANSDNTVNFLILKHIEYLQLSGIVSDPWGFLLLAFYVIFLASL